MIYRKFKGTLNMTNISLRLKTIASLVKHNAVLDIGSDHALLPVYLAENNADVRICATEIGEGPFNISKKAVISAGLSHKIELRRGDGLSPVIAGEFETAVIAGMGGMVIIGILSGFPEKARAFKQLILQPQRDAAAVRRFLYENNFYINNEAMLFEECRYYTIIDAAPGVSPDTYSSLEYEFGRKLIEKKCGVLKKYIENEIIQKKRVIANIPGGERFNELQGYIEMCEEVLRIIDN